MYHEENVAKRGVSPWLSITAPGYCHTVIKQQLSTDENLEMPPDTPENDMPRRERLDELSRTHWAVLQEGEYWFARLALRGGRTDVRRLTYTLSEEDICRCCQHVSCSPSEARVSCRSSANYDLRS